MTYIAPIQSLAGMETALYGGLGPNSSAPSYANGYMANSNIWADPYGNYGYGNIPNYNYQLSQNNGAINPTQTIQNTSNNEQQNWNILAKDYAKSLEPSEGFVGATVGGAAFGIINNPRLIAHPINTIKGFKDVKEIFKGVRQEGSALNKLWKQNSVVMEEAYAQMQKLSSRAAGWKAGLFRKQISDAEYKQLKGIMERAIKSGDINKIAEASQTLKHCYVSDGVLANGFRKVKGALGFNAEAPTVAKRLTETGKIAEKTTELLKHGPKMTYMDALKKGGGVKGGILFAALEFVMSYDKIKAAFSKDSSTGWSQVGQTAVKGAGSAVGWAAGEALGVWGAAKLGAAIGTAFGPGVGTAIGAVAGLIGGSIGCWLAGKATHAMVGQDVGDKILAQNKTKTDEGKLELLQYTMAKAQSGEKLSPNVQKATEELLAQYSGAA